MTTIAKPDYQFLKDLLTKESGLSLGDNKEYLLDSRLTPLCKELGLADIGALVAKLRQLPDSKVIKKINDLMTTNESLFFRDVTPFELLQKKFLPEFAEARASQKSLKIWSAACSTGQEPYSIAISLLEKAHLFSGWSLQIVATDIADHVLERAKTGAFSTHEVGRGLPSHLLLKYFHKREDHWIVNDDVKALVEFRNVNLLQPLPLQKVDIIFLRNVLIYFEGKLKSDVVNRMAQAASDNAILFLGAAETTLGLSQKWAAVEGVRSSVYRKIGEGK